MPTAVSNPGAAGGLGEQEIGISAPVPQPTPTPALYGSLSLPEVIDYEGPAHGLTLDIGIDRMLRENLDLRAKFFEIPQAQADILQAGLRANPIFYADGQLVPYGKYSRQRAGGPTQYDVNVSYPLDVSRKRIARTLVASRAKRVLEAQYQDAVRMRIDEFYSAFVDIAAGAADGPLHAEERRGARAGLPRHQAALREGGAEAGRGPPCADRVGEGEGRAARRRGAVPQDQARPGHLPEPAPRRGRRRWRCGGR